MSTFCQGIECRGIVGFIQQYKCEKPVQWRILRPVKMARLRSFPQILGNLNMWNSWICPPNPDKEQQQIVPECSDHCQWSHLLGNHLASPRSKSPDWDSQDSQNIFWQRIQNPPGILGGVPDAEEQQIVVAPAVKQHEEAILLLVNSDSKPRFEIGSPDLFLKYPCHENKNCALSFKGTLPV